MIEVMDVGVANERLLKKMQRELERASAQQKSGGNWRRHIERVHLLSELLLEEEPENTGFHGLQDGKIPGNRSGGPLFLFWNIPDYRDSPPEEACPDISYGPGSGGSCRFPEKSG